MRIRKLRLLLVLAAAAPASTAGAQAEPSRSGPFGRIGLGIGNATSDAFLGRTEDATGLLTTAHAGLGGRRVQFVLAFDWQTFRITDPGEFAGVVSSRVRFWYLLAGVQFVVGPRFYLGPSLGYARSTWSGPEAAVRNTDHVAAGFAFGAEWRLWRRQWVAAELGAQGAVDVGPDGSTSKTRLLSARLMGPQLAPADVLRLPRRVEADIPL